MTKKDEILEKALFREHLTLASFPKRILALIVDVIIVSIIASLMLSANQKESVNTALTSISSISADLKVQAEIQEKNGATDTKSDLSKTQMQLASQLGDALHVVLWYIVLLFVIDVIYNSLFLYLYGASLGLLLVKAKVVDSTYFDKPRLTQAITRSAISYILGKTFYISFIFAPFDKFKRTLHDRWSSCIVINS
ncbi:hypothetical protein BKH43_00075 [Helicobacter sp. 13S00401-1]|uniref:RDD family protein n=1 Tax=Helicobacter sp. 13S00401-1 TaxID=1905758 RepID=UPI000BA6512A|nr:RDD family protein [Helicobacter sp. 13S00401-1]PAF51675.1 hypothetical protein BKH43_00075 [Helicobacter sp. 13S00401-1]